MSVILRSGGAGQNQAATTQTITSTSNGEVLIRIGDARSAINGDPDENDNYPATHDRNQSEKNAPLRESSDLQYHVARNSGVTTATHTIYTKTSSSVIMHRESPDTSAVSYTRRHLTSSKIMPTDDSGPATNRSHDLVNTNVNGTSRSNNDDGVQTTDVDKGNINRRSSDVERHSLYIANSTNDACFSCHRSVYQPDKVGPLRGVMYHNLCFRCASCGTQLTLKTFCHNNRDMKDERVFCKSHQPSAESCIGDMSYKNIQSVINKPKLTQVNLNVRGGPHAGNAKGYGADAVGIRRAMNVPKLETYNQTVRVDADAQKGDKINHTALNVKTAMNVPRLDKYNQTVRPVPNMIHTG